MKKLLSVLCAVLCLGACDNQQSDKPVVKIGATLPLTGPFAESGDSAKAAINLAVQKWKQKDTKYNYQIFFENDAGNPKQAALNTQNFIGSKKASAVASFYGVVDRVVDDIANKNGVISLSCSYGKLTVPEYGINNCIQNEKVERILVPKLKKEGIKTVALVMSETKNSLVVGDYFEKALPKHGIKVVAYEKYNMDTRDMSTSILKMETLKPDYYLIFANNPLTEIFVKQLKEVAGKNNVASFGSFAEMDPRAYKSIENLWTIYSIAGTDEFEKEFGKATDGKRLKGCSANLYDNIDILIWAFENTPVREGNVLPDNADVIKTIRGLKNYAGASGTLDFSTGVAAPDAQLRMYHDGKFIKISEQ